MKSRLSSPVFYAVLALALTSLPALPARRERPQESRGAAAATGARQRPASPESAGATKFKENCSRCHEAPQGFSSRISGTILRHMRVRASLSAQDERDILHFLNP
jgi:hypothetical protein